MQIYIPLPSLHDCLVFGAGGLSVGLVLLVLALRSAPWQIWR